MNDELYSQICVCPWIKLFDKIDNKRDRVHLHVFVYLTRHAVIL